LPTPEQEKTHGETCEIWINAEKNSLGPSSKPDDWFSEVAETPPRRRRYSGLIATSPLTGARPARISSLPNLGGY